MYLIAGLGNPTRQYEHTRHNVGFDVIDALAEKYHISINEKKTQSSVGERSYKRTEGNTRKATDLYELKR